MQQILQTFFPIYSPRWMILRTLSLCLLFVCFSVPFLHIGLALGRILMKLGGYDEKLIQLHRNFKEIG